MPYEPIRPERLKQMLNQLREAIYEPVAELEVKAWVTPEPVSFMDRMTGAPMTLVHGERWGNLWDCAWFRFTGDLPENSRKEDHVLLLDINGELCLVDREGSPVQGLTTVNSEFDFSLGLPGKRVVRLHDMYMSGSDIEVWADAGNNDLFGKYQGGTLKEAVIAVCREDIRGLYYDVEVLLEVAERFLPEPRAKRESIRPSMTNH